MAIKDLTVVEMGWIVFVTQIIFLWLRTINVKYTAANNLWGAVITGQGIGLSWMVGIAVGANAMLEGNWFPIAMHLLGGGIGTYIGMRQSIKKKKQQNGNS